MKQTFLCLFVKEHEVGGYSVFAPDIPSCGTSGDDIEDAHVMIRECMDLCLVGAVEDTGIFPEAQMSTFAEALEWFRELMNYELDGETEEDRAFNENDLHIEMIEVEVNLPARAAR